MSVHTVLDPLRLARVRAAGRGDPRPRAAGGDLHDRRLRRGADAARRRAAPDPGRPVGRATSSRAARSGTTARLSDAIAVVVRGDRPRARAGRRAVVRDRDADPGRDRDRAGTRHGRGWTCRPTPGSMLIFGGSQAVAPVQRRGRGRAAAARRAGPCPPRHRRERLRGGPRRARATAGRTRRPRYRPYPFLRDDMLAALVAADLVVGRAGSSTLAEVTALGIPSVIVPYPHAAGHQTRERRGSSPTPARPGSSRTRTFDADALVAAADLLRPTTTRRAPRWPTAARGLGRPGAADAVAALVMAAAERRPLPDGRRRSSAIAAGSGRVTAAARRAAPFDAVAIGTAIQRRIGVKTSRDEPLARFTTMRVGGPADLFATVHNVHELRAIVRFARSREIPLTLLGRGSDVVIADAGIRGLVVQNRAEGSRIDEAADYIAESGRADGPRRDRDAEGRPDAASSSGWRSRAPSAAPSGRTPAPTRTTSPRSSTRPTSCSPTARRRASPRPTSTSATATAGSRRSPATSSSARRSASSRPTRPTIAGRLDEIRRWRREHQPLGIPSAGSAFRNPPGDSAGRLIDDGRAEGLTRRRRGDLREARELHRQRPEGHRRRRPGRPRRVPATRSPGSPASSSCRRSCSSATGGARRDVDRRRRHPDRRPPRRPVGGARRVGRVGDRDRRGARDERPRRRADPDRPRRPLVAAAGRPPPRRVASRRPTTIRAALGASGPETDRRGASTGSPARTRRRSSSSPSTARSARTARSRRCSRRPASPTPAPGVTASAIGMDKAVFKRLVRGIGLPVVDWIEVRAARWAGGPRRRPRPARGVRRRDRRPAADGQAVAARLAASG